MHSFNSRLVQLSPPTTPHSLHDAYSSVYKPKWVTPVERGDLRSASQSRDYFIARIHGNAEHPETLAVDINDYQALANDGDYLDFILHLFQSRSCLFFGFSFLDPAIRHVLELHAAKHGPVFRELHTALIPMHQPDLANQLRAVNIQVIEYDDSNAHADAWKAIRQLRDTWAASAHRPPSIDPTFGRGALHRFLAFTHTQASMRPHVQPITDIARDGLVASLVSSAGGSISEGTVRKRVASLLGLSLAEAGHLVTTSLDRLVGHDCARRTGSTVMWTGPEDFSVDRDLDELTDSVVHRMRVRYGVRAAPQDRRAAKAVIEHVLLTRAWDLGAHFASGQSGANASTGSIVQSSLSSLQTLDQPKHERQLGGAVQGLLDAPDNNDAELLTRLGRIAFGVQLVLASPRQTLFHQYALPQTVYLDTNVLLPKITDGHPLEPAYSSVIRQLTSAARHAGAALSIAVGDQFLNEIIAHRDRAIEMVERGGLEDSDALRRHIQFYSAVNTNVFVGAYGTALAETGRSQRFSNFLEVIAPYQNEAQLAEHLQQNGIQTVTMSSRRHEYNADFVSILNPLKDGYDNVDRAKASVLIEHEAAQITQLRLDADNNIASVFVTADGKLRRAVVLAPELRPMSRMLLSHLGLIALTDVVVGIGGGDAGSLARMLWLSTDTNRDRSLVEYFVNLGLRKYDENMSRDLQSLAEKCAEDATNEATLQKLDLSMASKDIEQTAKFLDRFEDRFYKSWDEAIKRRLGE